MNLAYWALRRPITVLVTVAGVLLGAWLALRQMARDILPNLGIPTLYVVQPYGGMSPEQMEGYLTYYFEYHFLFLPGIEHIESRNIQGVSLIKLQFHPGTDMAQALAATINMANRAKAFMPPGAVPPFVMRFDAGSVPVGDLVFSSESRTVGELQDFALNRVRPLFATLAGVSAPPPFGSSQRTIVIRVNPDRLRADRLSLEDVIRAVSAANLLSPAGNVRLGGKYPMVPVNSIVRDISELEEVPIRPGSTPPILIGDVATVSDGTDIQTGFALVNGRRTVYIPVTKRATASTLAVANLVKQNLARFESVLPPDVKVDFVFDQSRYVKRAIKGLTAEGALGALLTGLMVLLFLRDWRSAVIVVTNIPVSLLAAVIALWMTRQTVNVMTLGGLALAVGILVDEATVAIENIHTHLARGKTAAQAALDAARETAGPRLLGMVCVLAVFLPSFFMVGAARALFVPLSLAVGFSMIASYFLSSTFVPVVSTWLLRGQEAAATARPHSAFARFQARYAGWVDRLMRVKLPLLGGYLVLAIGLVWSLGRMLGTEIFPQVDVGQLELRLRAPTGTQIEGTERIATNILQMIKQEVGPTNVAISVGFVGVQPPNYPINTIYLWTSGPEEAVMDVQLKPESPVRVEPLKSRLRERVTRELPGVQLSFEPADIVSRALSFGSPTPVAVEISGPDLAANRRFAYRVHEALLRIASLRDLHYGETFDYPTVAVRVDRERAGIMGVTMARVVGSLVAATSSSRYVVPNYWADPRSGIAYQVQVEAPQEQLNSLDQIRNIPIGFRPGRSMLLRNVARVTRGTTFGEYDRFDMQRMVSLYANITGNDLGRVAKQVLQAIKRLGPPPRGVTVHVRGQVVPLEEMLGGLRTGLLLAVILIFLFLAANFQSVKLSFLVVVTAPAVLAGVVGALWLMRTTLNVQSFMGAIMAVGIALANAILLVTVAERNRMNGATAAAAAVEAARSRLRPILMTSLAMIAGMAPMAVGWGEGGQQTAPLGRAVVGGLVLATVATLTVLPAVFAVVQAHAPRRSASLIPVRPAVQPPPSSLTHEPDSEA